MHHFSRYLAPCSEVSSEMGACSHFRRYVQTKPTVRIALERTKERGLLSALRTSPRKPKKKEKSKRTREGEREEVERKENIHRRRRGDICGH